MMRLGRTLPPAAAPLSCGDVMNGFRDVFRSRQAVDRFVAELKEYFRVKHCFLLSSGTAALTMILSALREMYPSRDEVIVPAYTCYSVPAAVARSGLKVRPCDVDPETLDYDYGRLQQELWGSQSMDDRKNDSSNHRVLAVLAVHLFGGSADLARLNSILPDPVSLIEDAAQAMGGFGRNGLLGISGRASFFSLGRGKALTTLDGGIILTNNDRLAAALQEKAEHLPDPGLGRQAKQVAKATAFRCFQHPRLFWIPKLLPFLRLGETIYDPAFLLEGFTPFQAGLARTWQDKLQRLRETRSRNVAWWNSHLDFDHHLKPKTRNNESSTPALLRYPLLARNPVLRNRIVAWSEERGLGIMSGYPDSIDSIQGLELVKKEDGFPGAKACAERLFTLPVHPWITEKDRNRIKQMLGTLDR